MGPKATARAARWAVGVDDSTHGVRGRPRTPPAAAFGRIRDAWTAAGRTEAPHISASLWYALGDGAADRLSGYVYDYMRIFGEDLGARWRRWWPRTPPEALRDAVATLDELGCDELFLVPTTTDVAELDRTREALDI